MFVTKKTTWIYFDLNEKALKMNDDWSSEDEQQSESTLDESHSLTHHWPRGWPLSYWSTDLLQGFMEQDLGSLPYHVPLFTQSYIAIFKVEG